MKLHCAALTTALLAFFLTTAIAQDFITNGLVAYYPFNGNANDAEGTNNGIIHGGVVLAPDRFGSNNSAYAFNGVDGYIDVGNPVGNSPSNLTETAWVKMISRDTSGIVPEDVIITKRQTPFIGSGWPDLVVESAAPNAGAGEIIVDADNYGAQYRGTSHTQTNVWFFICEVKSNNTYQIYVNGALENTATDSQPLSSVENMYLMHHGAWGTYCHGMLDDVRIYNRALPANEVAELYAVESDFCSPHAAQATAQVFNKFFIGATITDGGCGYTNAPEVLIVGGGGSGATATATIQNGFVTAINITNPGSGYTNLPDVEIASPPFTPTQSIGVYSVYVASHVVLGLNYLIESSPDLVNWTATGPEFTAQSESITNIFLVNQTGRYFRIRQVP
jgi:hypothetical protein